MAVVSGTKSVAFLGEVVSVSVKSKKVKMEGEDGVKYEGTVKLGKLTLEFDGDRVDVTALAGLTHGRLVTLGIENTQRELEFNASSADSG